MATDPRDFAAAWEPQLPGRRAPRDIPDPIIEPDWGGLRAVVAITDGKAEIYRYSDRIDVPRTLEEALGYAFEAEDGVIEGHLTTQAFDTGIGAFPAQTAVSRPILAMPRIFKRSSSTDPYVYGRRQHTEEESRAPEILDALADGVDHAFVAIDLLWLDGQPLADVPLLERKRLLDTVLAQSRLVRVTPFVRPGGSRMANTWGTLGFDNVCWRAANGRYTPGKENPDWAVAPAPGVASRVPTTSPADPAEPSA